MKLKVKSLFKNNPGRQFKRRGIAKRLDIITEHEYSALKAVLYDLEKEEYINKIGKKYILNLKQSTIQITGTLQVNKSGYGFVVVSNTKMKDIYISNNNLENALDGDTVNVEIIGGNGKSSEGKIIEIIKRKRKIIEGYLTKKGTKSYVQPIDEYLPSKIGIIGEIPRDVKLNDKVIVTDIVWEKSKKNPAGRVEKFKVNEINTKNDFNNLVEKFNLPHIFNKKTLDEIKSIPFPISDEEIKQRLDYRNKVVFTIDPFDAKDFDDALSIEEDEEGNCLVGIHIADVSHCINSGSELDKEAQKRGNSIYLVGQVIPMLPEQISNNVCSLRPNEDRLTYSIFIKITKKGKILNFNSKKCVINSNRRFTYEEVQEIIDNKAGEYSEEILKLNSIAIKLREKRLKEGSIEFFTPEVKIELNEIGKPINVVLKEFIQSNSLVEEFMLLANKLVAESLSKSKKNKEFIYRVHDLPDAEKVKEFANFVKKLGYNFSANADTKVNKFQTLISEAKGKEEQALINELAIRSMAKAVYSTKNIGHYGLGFKYYTHFTSPIRRYADLEVHRLLFAQTNKKETKFKDKKYLTNLCDHISLTERDAVEAERYSTKLKQVQFLSEHIGNEFDGIISGIVYFGLFIKLIDTLAEGLVRLKDIKDDYYFYDEKSFSIIGDRTKKTYRLGDKVKVKLIKADVKKTEIDFIIT
ncbi:MAG: ribonuclease R [Ignavibacteriales bacterium CG_4_9_14_3_um_filter_30_11]|nr:MAG: ribonuclease R [Ignavibacteriales bacterium CG_4_9_14_3_um_filter_30_11]